MWPVMNQAVFLFLSPALLAGAEYFVSGSGSDANDGRSAASAFRSIQKAADLTAPGDIVSVLDGDYTNSCASCAVVSITRSGTADAWIAYRAYNHQSPRITFTGWAGFSLTGGASFIEISGFEVQGSRADVSFQHCSADRLAANPDPICNGNGISIDGRNDGAKKPHHLLIARNHTWQCGGAGIGAIQSDYVTIEDNQVNENAWYSRYATSGISVFQSWSSDASTTTKTIIRGNRVYNNRALVIWTVTGALSDGNGIIIDTSLNTQGSTIGPYNGRFRVENNLSYDNGGAGINVFDSAHADLINNTLYKNGQVVEYADLFINQSADVRAENNIVWARTGASALTVYSSTATLDYNLYWNTTPVSPTGTHDLAVDPELADPTTDPVTADFHPLAASPAVGSGDPSLAPADDLEGVPRSGQGGITRGAFQSVARSSAGWRGGRGGFPR
jgi:parallel beta-helix repeat protein